MSKHTIRAGKAVDLHRLREELSAELGRPVSLAGEPATADEAGEIVLFDPATGGDLAVPRDVVSRVMAAHAVPHPAEPATPLTSDEITRLRDMLAGR